MRRLAGVFIVATLLCFAGSTWAEDAVYYGNGQIPWMSTYGDGDDLAVFSPGSIVTGMAPGKTNSTSNNTLTAKYITASSSDLASNNSSPMDFHFYGARNPFGTVTGNTVVLDNVKLINVLGENGLEVGSHIASSVYGGYSGNDEYWRQFFEIVPPHTFITELPSTSSNKVNIQSSSVEYVAGGFAERTDNVDASDGINYSFTRKATAHGNQVEVNGDSTIQRVFGGEADIEFHTYQNIPSDVPADAAISTPANITSLASSNQVWINSGKIGAVSGGVAEAYDLLNLSRTRGGR